MAATIYSAPEEIAKPTFNFENFNQKEHEASENKYIADLKAFLAERGYDGKNAGETISFPAADSQAVYMVVSMKPLALIHVPVGDEWSYDNVDLMTAQRVQEMLDQKKAWADFAEKNRKEKGK